MADLSASHCENIEKDRKEGRYWEDQFSRMAGRYGYSRVENQAERNGAAIALGPDGERFILPDVTLRRNGQTEYHEVKHKNPTRFDAFGLEVYRFDSLLWLAQETGQDVLYTIHNHNLAGGKNIKENNIEHWITANILDLNENWIRRIWGDSWVGGRRRRVPIYFWQAGLWCPLRDYWDNVRITQLQLAL